MLLGGTEMEYWPEISEAAGKITSKLTPVEKLHYRYFLAKIYLFKVTNRNTLKTF